MVEFDPNKIVIATTTFYPNWKSNQGSVHGDLAIEFVHEVRERGYQIVVVDGGSSDDFKTHLENMELKWTPLSIHEIC